MTLKFLALRSKGVKRSFGARMTLLVTPSSCVVVAHEHFIARVCFCFFTRLKSKKKMINLSLELITNRLVSSLVLVIILKRTPNENC